MSQCSELGCEKPATARGLCNTHYMRQRRAGLVPIGTRAPAPAEERFWRYVRQSPGCWDWIGNKTPKGYGKLGAGGKDGKGLLAHRLSFELHKGEIPMGAVVMHMCDNPSCVNPAHLVAGTQSENIKQAFEKGRKVCRPPLHEGESHWAATVTEADVRAIRAEVGRPIRHIAKERGLSESTVARILKRITWKHVV
jgi:hypothetical protein